MKAKQGIHRKIPRKINMLKLRRLVRISYSS
jgi:hypothetical protein